MEARSPDRLDEPSAAEMRAMCEALRTAKAASRSGGVVRLQGWPDPRTGRWSFEPVVSLGKQKA